MVLSLICLLLLAFTILLLVYVVFSWIPSPPEPLLPVVRGVHRIVNPILEPIRRVLPPLRMGGMGLDLSVLAVFFLVIILRSVIGCA